MRLLHVAPDRTLALTKDLSPPLSPYAMLSRPTTWKRRRVQTRLDIPNCGSVSTNPRRMGWNTAGSTYAVLIKRITSSSPKPSRPCFIGTKTRPDATSISTDVSVGGDSRPVMRHTWEPAFRMSRWFRRGWTLQELLAPASVEFFSVNGLLLGHKQVLETLIHEITALPISACAERPCRHSQLTSDYNGLKDVRRQRLKIEHTVFWGPSVRSCH